MKIQKTILVERDSLNQLIDRIHTAKCENFLDEYPDRFAVIGKPKSIPKGAIYFCDEIEDAKLLQKFKGGVILFDIDNSMYVLATNDSM
jgi:hypothetical protein